MIDGLKLVPVGSRITCNPAPTNTDQDFLCLTGIENDIDGPEFHRLLGNHGFSWEGKVAYKGLENVSPFRSWRNGDINIIVTNYSGFYNKFLLATALAKRFNLLDKDDRIALFQAVLYGEEYNVYKIKEKE